MVIRSLSASRPTPCPLLALQDLTNPETAPEQGTRSQMGLTYEEWRGVLQFPHPLSGDTSGTCLPELCEVSEKGLSP